MKFHTVYRYMKASPRQRQTKQQKNKHHHYASQVESTLEGGETRPDHPFECYALVDI